MLIDLANARGEVRSGLHDQLVARATGEVRGGGPCADEELSVADRGRLLDYTQAGLAAAEGAADRLATPSRNETRP